MNMTGSKYLACLLVAAGTLICTMIQAQPLIVIPPEQPVAAGDQVAVTVYFQAGHLVQAKSAQAPDELSIELTNGERKQQLVLHKLPDPSASVRLPAGVVQAQYRLLLPSDITEGALRLQVLSFTAPPVYMLAYQSPTEPVAEQPTLQMVSVDDSKDEDLILNDFLGSIYGYHPTYFIAGANPTDAKLQLSFKYRFINRNSQLAEQHEWLGGFYFAYTQLSLWDLSSESFPFEDTNFLPELFYQFNDLTPILNAATHADLQLGLLHESNGRDGDDSRSLNVAYLEPGMHFDLAGEYQLSLTPRVWAYFGSKSGNENIQDFRGNASLTATYGRRNGFQLEAYLRGNPGTGKGAMQLDFTYPLTRITNDVLGLYLHAQLFRGFGESLLEFDQRDTRFRIGLGLVR